jgi:hypothetical protein
MRPCWTDRARPGWEGQELGELSGGGFRSRVQDLAQARLAGE